MFAVRDDLIARDLGVIKPTGDQGANAAALFAGFTCLVRCSLKRLHHRIDLIRHLSDLETRGPARPGVTGWHTVHGLDRWYAIGLYLVHREAETPPGSPHHLKPSMSEFHVETSYGV